MGKILGIDYGKRKVGLAESDSMRLMVFPREVLKYAEEADLLKRLKNILNDNDFDLVVLGLPMAIDGAETKQSKEIRAFGERLSDFLGNGIKIDYADESFSSYEAQGKLRGMGYSGKQMTGKEDAMAAAVFLERYIDTVL